MKPLIGIIAANYQDDAYYMVRSTYINETIIAGGTPLIIPFNVPVEEGKKILEKLDGLLIPGGIDVSPRLYGEEPIKEVTKSVYQQDVFEIELIREAYRLNKPILAICRGIQVLNVAFGGTLYQDIHAQNAATFCHSQNSQDPQMRGEKTQTVSISPDSVLYKIYGTETAYVNSFHHQAVKDLAKPLIATAHSMDHIIEACETIDGRVLGVQWHPEMLAPYDADSRKLFHSFIELCS